MQQIQFVHRVKGGGGGGWDIPLALFSLLEIKFEIWDWMKVVLISKVDPEDPEDEQAGERREPPLGGISHALTMEPVRRLPGGTRGFLSELI